MVEKRTPVAKRIKTHYFDANMLLAWDAAVYNFYPHSSWLVQENITIVGVSGKVASSFSVMPQVAGAIHTHAELSRAGQRAQPGAIWDCESNCWINASPDAHVGDPNQGRTVMFPEGYGIDVDDGEFIYLHMGCFCACLNAGNHEHACYVIIYYVER